MIVFCEDCGERYILNIEDTRENPDQFTCRRCAHIITISKDKHSSGIDAGPAAPLLTISLAPEKEAQPTPDVHGNASNGPGRIEKRDYERIYFTMESGPRIRFIVAGCPDDDFEAVVVNVSEEGMRLMAGVDSAPFLHEGYRIQIKTVDRNRDLSVLAGETAEVCWTLDHLPMPYIGLGCKFIGNPENTRRRLQRMVKSALGEPHERALEK